MKLKINLSIATQHSNNKMQKSKIKLKQDGPSLESSSYLNLRLRYLGPQDLLTQRPLDSWTLGLWDLFPPPPPPPISSSYTILPPFIFSFLLLLS